MNSSLVRADGRTWHLCLPLSRFPTLLLAGLLFLFRPANAAESPTFAPLPTQPTFALTNGIILLSPSRLNFGTVPLGKSATNTLLVENFGHGKLVGTASVPPPFKIISGEKYALKEKEVQVVTIVYTPGKPHRDKAIVTFTGGNGAKAMVIGKTAEE
jgi:hypothetical protein